MEEYKRLIMNYLNRYDPNNEIVKIDKVKKVITYSSSILTHAPVRYEDEGYVRAYLVVKLIKELKYPIECIELEVPYINRIGSNPKDNTAYLDILLRDRREQNKVYFMIECKSPNKYDEDKKNIETQLFNIANIQERSCHVKYLLYYSVNEVNIKDRNIIIDYEKYKNYQEWLLDDEKEELNVIPEDYGISYNAKFARVTPNQAKELGYNPLDDTITKEQLDKLKIKLHNILWGGGSTNYNDVFYYLMHIFLAKIYDEMKRKEKEVYEFQIYYEDGKKEMPNRTFKRIENLYREAQEKLLNQPIEVINQSTFIDLDKMQLTKVIGAVKLLQGISLTENKNHSDILGQFFEDIVSEDFKQDKGQFFTPENLVKFIIESLGIKENAIERLNKENEDIGLLPYIIDPSCGSGTFLLEVMKEISNYYLDNKDKVNISSPIQGIVNHSLFIEDEKRTNSINTWAQTYIYGIEPNVELATASKVNMILHGDGNANIFINNGLASFGEYNRPARITKAKENKLMTKKITKICNKDYELNEEFDFIITNPPFSLTFGDEDEDIEKYKSRFIYGNKKSSENLFIERWYQLLKEGGRVGAILPDSVFDTLSNKYIRMFLLKYFHVNAVVSLDEVAFKPYTSTKVSILFATKKKKLEVEEFELKWNEYSKEYNNLWKEKIIQLVIENDKLLNSKNGLKNLCNKYGIKLESKFKLLNSKLFPKKLYDNILEKIINESDYCEEYLKLMQAKVELEDIELICKYNILKKKKKKYLTKEEKYELKKLNDDSNVKNFIKIEERSIEILNQIGDYKLLNKIYKFVENNEFEKLDGSHTIKVLQNLLNEYYPSNYMLQEQYDNKLKCIREKLNEIKVSGNQDLNTHENIIEVIKNINAIQCSLEVDKVKEILNNIKINNIDLIIEEIIKLFKSQTSNFVTDLSNIIERSYELILNASALDYPNYYKTKSEMMHNNAVNYWWVIRRVNKDLDRNILYAQANELGYKRTKKIPYIKRPNELFFSDQNGNIIIDKENPKSILDYIKKVNIWDNKSKSMENKPENINVFTTPLSKIGNQFFLRLDSKYRELWDLNETPTVTKKLKVGDILYKMDALKKEKGILDEEMNILDISLTEARYGKLDESIQKVEEIGSDKTILDEAEFIVSKLCMSKGYIFNNENNINNLIGSTELIPYIRKDKKVDLNFLRNILLDDIYLKTYDKLETGKTPSQKRVNPIDFMQLSIPDVAYETQEELGKYILESEEKVKTLKEKIEKERKELEVKIFDSIR